MTKARDLANAADALDDVSATELGYVNGVTSAIQTQLNNKQAVVSGVDDTEIGYLNGVTSSIQTQLDSKIAKSLVDAAGDLIYGSANDTVTRLGIGTAGQYLKVNSGATAPEWATLSAGGMTLLSTTTLSGTTTTVSSIDGSYTQLMIRVLNPVFNTGGQRIQLYFNGNTTATYYMRASSQGSATLEARNGDPIQLDPNQDNTGGGYISTTIVDSYATTNRKSFVNSQLLLQSGAYRGGFCIGGIGINSAITSVTVAGSLSYAFTGGTIEVWGIK